MAESKGFNLADVLKGVPKLDTADGRKQIEYIDIDLLDDDPKNFYTLSDLDQLVENIELVGLQQPIVVRPNPDAAGRFIIVSGHRRRAAVRKLLEEGREDLRQLPCLRDDGEASPAMQELRLIFANSGTRKLSSAEISAQAERVEMLLYQLKEEGVEFPGRMRDHVAEACQVSKSKLARLKVIREGLIPELKKFWENGKMKEAVAYACAQHPTDLQRRLIKYSKKFEYYTTPDHWYENTVKDRAAMIKAEDSLACRRRAGGGECDNSERRLEFLASGKSYYDDNCRKKKCCSGCGRIGTCRYACSRLDSEIKKAKAARKEELAKKQKAQEEKDRPVVRGLRELWHRFGWARDLADASVKECAKALEIYYSSDMDEKYTQMEGLEGKFTANTGTPFGWRHSLDAVQTISRLADLLGCSIDYLFCRTDVREMATSSEAPAAAPGEGWITLMWIDGFRPPHEPRHAVAVFDCEGTKLRYLAYWDGEDWLFKKGGVIIGAKCVRWFPVPNEEDDDDET